MSVESVIVLLNNIEEMVRISNMRREAVDAMKALKIYARQKHIEIPTNKIDQYIDVVYDSRPETLSNIVREIVSQVVQDNRKEIQKIIKKNS